MSGKFITANQVERDEANGGVMGWLSRPSTTGAKDLVVIEVVWAPGTGHAFHKHPTQEEVIYIIEGEVEQWLDKEKMILGPGDSVFIEADVVHASYNTSNKPAKMLAILAPCRGDDGYVTIDLFDEEPWKSMR